MGCIQFNEKLASRPKIGITAKQFWNGFETEATPVDFANTQPM